MQLQLIHWRSNCAIQFNRDYSVDVIGSIFESVFLFISKINLLFHLNCNTNEN